MNRLGLFLKTVAAKSKLALCTERLIVLAFKMITYKIPSKVWVSRAFHIFLIKAEFNLK